MKKLLLLCLLLIPVAGIAQENTAKDTTLYVNGRKISIKEGNGKIKVKLYEQSSHGDTIENDQIFEGVYMDGQSTERRFELAVPFSKSKKSYGHFDPHYAGLYMGYTNLADNLSFNNANGIDLVSSKSWEIGLNLFQGSFVLSADRHWGLTTGLGFGYTSFRVDGNKGFKKIGNATVLVAPSQEIEYSQSRLRYNHFRIPLLLEWQSKCGNKGPIFASLGAEAEIRCWVKSKAEYDGHGHTLGKDLNVRPVGLNLLAQIGFDDIGAYLRYSPISLFEKDKGPDWNPVSFGLVWYW